jgi:hypothetical protein
MESQDFEKGTGSSYDQYSYNFYIALDCDQIQYSMSSDVEPLVVTRIGLEFGQFVKYVVLHAVAHVLFSL